MFPFFPPFFLFLVFFFKVLSIFSKRVRPQALTAMLGAGRAQPPGADELLPALIMAPHPRKKPSDSVRCGRVLNKSRRMGSVVHTHAEIHTSVTGSRLGLRERGLPTRAGSRSWAEAASLQSELRDGKNGKKIKRFFPPPGTRAGAQDGEAETSKSSVPKESRSMCAGTVEA